MLTLLPNDWRIIALRGVAAIAFGVLTLVWPGLTVWALVLLFGAYALVDGVFTLMHATDTELSGRHRAVLVLEGLAGVAAGIIAFAWPGITALALLYIIAAWAIVIGVMEIAAAIRLRDVFRHTWLFGVAGAASIIFGILLLITPGAGALVITWLIGWYALFVGVTLLALAWRQRRSHSELRDSTASPLRQAPV
jgi:uncharacterized membrane protein HdeD (DUF308 family)